MDYGLWNRALLMMLTFDFTSLKCSFEMWTCIETHVVRKKITYQNSFSIDSFFCASQHKNHYSIHIGKCTEHALYRQYFVLLKILLRL